MPEEADGAVEPPGQLEAGAGLLAQGHQEGVFKSHGWRMAHLCNSLQQPDSIPGLILAANASAPWVEACTGPREGAWRHDHPAVRPSGQCRAAPRRRRAADPARPSFGPARALVRAGLAERLATAAAELPAGIALRVVEGLRSARRPARHHRRLLRPGPRRAPRCLATRSCASWSQPVRRAAGGGPARGRRGGGPHPVRRDGDELDMGTAVDATPEAVRRRAATPRTGRSAPTPARTATLAGHGAARRPGWSTTRPSGGTGRYGDRYWALITGARRRALRPGRAPRPGPRREPPCPSPRCPSPRRRPLPAARCSTIDASAVAANTRLLASRATGELMAVVKADGFGHGAVDVARTALAARRHLARRDQHRRGAAAARGRASTPGAELAQPGRRRLRRRRRAPTSRSPCRAASTSTRSSARRRGRRGAPAPRHRHGPRRRGTRPRGPTCAGPPGAPSARAWCGSSA